MASLTGFNASEVPPNEGFDPLPAGEYTAMIVASEEKSNAKGTGTYVKLTIEVLDGDYKGRKLWELLNLNNPNAQAVQIARGTLSAICRAVNKLTPGDSADLHNIPMIIKVGLEKRDDTGEMQNRIKGWKQKGGTAPTTNVGGSTPPWLQKK